MPGLDGGDLSYLGRESPTGATYICNLKAHMSQAVQSCIGLDRLAMEEGRRAKRCHTSGVRQSADEVPLSAQGPDDSDSLASR